MKKFLTNTINKLRSKLGLTFFIEGDSKTKIIFEPSVEGNEDMFSIAIVKLNDLSDITDIKRLFYSIIPTSDGVSLLFQKGLSFPVTVDTIPGIGSDLVGLKVVHMKTKDKYLIQGWVIDCDNQTGYKTEVKVIYTSRGLTYSRDLGEFFTKFLPIELYNKI